MRIEFDFRHTRPFPNTCLSFQIVNQAQVPVLHFCAYDHPEVQLCKGVGTTTVVCNIPRLNLNVGQYTITTDFSDPPGGSMHQHLEGICQFSVDILDKTTLWGWRPEVCTYFEDGNWSVASQP